MDNLSCGRKTVGNGLEVEKLTFSPKRTLRLKCQFGEIHRRSSGPILEMLSVRFAHLNAFLRRPQVGLHPHPDRQNGVSLIHKPWRGDHMKTETRRTHRSGALTDTAPETQRLSIRQAATMAGKGVTTVRRMIEKGLIQAHKDDTGQYWVEEESLKHHLVTEASPGKVSVSSGEVTGRRGRVTDTRPEQVTEALRLEAHIRDLQASLDHERRVSADLRAENRDITSELLKITREMQALLVGGGKTEGLLPKKRWNPFNK